MIRVVLKMNYMCRELIYKNGWKYKKIRRLITRCCGKNKK